MGATLPLHAFSSTSTRRVASRAEISSPASSRAIRGRPAPSCAVRRRAGRRRRHLRHECRKRGAPQTRAAARRWRSRLALCAPPISPTVPQAQDLNVFKSDAIYEQIRRPNDKPLTGTGDMALPADKWMGFQMLDRLPDTLRNSSGSIWIVARDVLLGFDEIRQRRTGPASPQTFTPHLAKAA